jgi:hypothetical protein
MKVTDAQLRRALLLSRLAVWLLCVARVLVDLVARSPSFEGVVATAVVLLLPMFLLASRARRGRQQAGPAAPASAAPQRSRPAPPAVRSPEPRFFRGPLESRDYVHIARERRPAAAFAEGGKSQWTSRTSL